MSPLDYYIVADNLALVSDVYTDYMTTLDDWGAWQRSLTDPTAHPLNEEDQILSWEYMLDRAIFAEKYLIAMTPWMERHCALIDALADAAETIPST